MTFLLLAVGLALLVVGGDILVRGAVGLAARLGVSPLLIGLTVVGFGTSTPELVTSLDAAFSGLPGISVGNVVGSNIANIGLILGLTALIAPVAVARRTLWRDGLALSLASLAALAAVANGALDRVAGAGLVLGLVGYIALAYRLEKRGGEPAQDGTEDAPRDALWKSLGLALGGIAVTILGARFLVLSAVDIARGFGVSETLIGLTIVAVGTSLPELVTSVMAARRHQPELAFGNVVGSNIYNILGILGVTALVHPIPVPPEILRLDIWVMLAATAGLIAAAASGGRVSRREGLLMLAGYGAYVGWLAVSALDAA